MHTTVKMPFFVYGNTELLFKHLCPSIISTASATLKNSKTVIWAIFHVDGFNTEGIWLHTEITDFPGNVNNPETRHLAD